MKLLIAIHGILQKATSPGWVDELDAWIVSNLPGVKVIKKKYNAGPFPRINCFWKDPILARQIANEVELFFGPRSVSERSASAMPSAATGDRSRSGADQIYFVSHSNGAVIALKAIKLLAQRGLRTEAAIFAQAAIESDVEKNGIAKLAGDGMLGRAIAWSNTGDEVVHFHGLKKALAWPYGSLGHDGWTLNGQPFSDGTRIFTRMLPEAWGHNGCWSGPARLNDSFQAIRKTLQNA